MKKDLIIVLLITVALALLSYSKVDIAEYAMGEKTAVPTHKCAVVWFNGNASDLICMPLKGQHDYKE